MTGIFQLILEILQHKNSVKEYQKNVTVIKILFSGSE